MDYIIFNNHLKEWNGYKDVYFSTYYYKGNNLTTFLYEKDDKLVHWIAKKKDDDEFEFIADGFIEDKVLPKTGVIIVKAKEDEYKVFNYTDNAFYPINFNDLKDAYFIDLIKDIFIVSFERSWWLTVLLDKKGNIIKDKNWVLLDNLVDVKTPEWDTFYFSKKENWKYLFCSYNINENQVYFYKGDDVFTFEDVAWWLDESILKLKGGKYIYVDNKMQKLTDVKYDKAKLFYNNRTARVSIKSDSFLIDENFQRIGEEPEKKVEKREKIIPPHIDTKALWFKPIIDEMEAFVLKTNISPQRWGNEDLEIKVPEEFISFHEEVLTSSDDFWYALENGYVEVDFITDKKLNDLTKKELDAIKVIVDFYGIEF